MSDCFYCRKDERLLNLMVPICELRSSDIYLFRDQRYRGRCVVALQEHKREWFELREDLMLVYTRELAATAQALQRVFRPDKLNYAVYGDIVDHFHYHLVPKYRDGFGWGQPFRTEAALAVPLEEEEYQRLCITIKAHILENLSEV
ncbi:HIT family protein [Paenibacillus sp. TRM 82003]|nr:HIT family protein [Paenibacillus sp. TRM 82003]